MHSPGSALKARLQEAAFLLIWMIESWGEPLKGINCCWCSIQSSDERVVPGMQQIFHNYTNNDNRSGKEKQNAPQDWSRSTQNIHSTSGNSTRERPEKRRGLDWTGLSIPNNINIFIHPIPLYSFSLQSPYKDECYTIPKRKRNFKKIKYLKK